MSALPRLDPDWVWQNLNRPTEVDQDIISFCAFRPHLIELAFTLADNGHTHVGHIARLTEYTVIDLAGGSRDLASQLARLLHRVGLDFDMHLVGWEAPSNDALNASDD